MKVTRLIEATKGNVEYETINQNSDRPNSVYGSYSFTIKVLNDVSEEDVIKAFDGPLTKIKNNGNNTYTIVRYND